MNVLRICAHHKLNVLSHEEGTIQPGSDADFVIWRKPSDRQTSNITAERLHTACDYTPFEGHEVLDWPRWTILRGQVVYDGATNEIKAEPGFGQFLKRDKSKLAGPRGKWLSAWRPQYEVNSSPQ